VSSVRSRFARVAPAPPLALGGLGSLAAASALVAIAPLVFSGYQLYVLGISLGYATAALGVATALRALGALALTQAAMMAVGGYVLVELFASLGLPFPLALVAAPVACAFISGIFAALTTGMTDLAFAILGFAFTFVVTQVLSGHLLKGISGGELGRPVPPGSFFGYSTNGHLAVYYFVAAVALVFFALASMLLRSSLGRSVLQVGDDEVVATALGIPINRLKVASLALVGAYGGLGGALAALASGFVAPPTFGPDLIPTLMAIVLLGGTGYLLAGLVGAVVLQGVPGMINMSAVNRELLIGVVLLLVLVFARQGVLGEVDLALGRLRRRRP
jgi:branched-chain amino acid transport system permease protein